ncbi:hypothetical protein [Polaribacter sp.]|uniref:hypothetical protein n=1 Tax=Polaribacter sp. TaxID=1920175 RepID=UPI0040482F48
MKNSIFRTEKIVYKEETPKNHEFNSSTELIIKNYRTHDDGIPRGRVYSLDTVIKFSIFKGYTIENIILENFDYFLWFGIKIENFIYDEKVTDYAQKYLNILINLEYPRIEKSPKLKYMRDQISLMLEYEYELDFGSNPYLTEAYKSMINVNFYKTIYGKPIEKIIRYSLTRFRYRYSDEYRIKYLNEIKEKFNQNNA